MWAFKGSKPTVFNSSPNFNSCNIANTLVQDIYLGAHISVSPPDELQRRKFQAIKPYDSMQLTVTLNGLREIE